MNLKVGLFYQSKNLKLFKPFYFVMVKQLRFLTLLLSISLCSEREADSFIMSGVTAFYNYEFSKSIEILDQARLRYPNHPGVHFIWASSKYYISQGLDPIESTYDTLENALNEIEPIYIDLVKNKPNEDEYKLYLGSTIGMRARSSLGRKDWISVLKQSYKGFKKIEKVAERNPEMIDAQLPMGIVGYYASISNVFIRWLINIYGINTSKEVAIQKIKNAAYNSDWAWIEASGILSFIYLWIENQPQDALNSTVRLAKEFPKNFYFQILYLESLTRTSNFEEAKRKINELNDNFKSLSVRQKAWYKPYFDYQKALFYFHQMDYDKSREFTMLAIDNYSGELDVILGNLYLLNGKLNDIVNNRDDAVRYYKLCRNLDNFSYASKEAIQFIKVPFAVK